MVLSNQELTKHKKEIIRKPYKRASKCIRFSFHGIAISFHTTSSSLFENLDDFIPRSWLTNEEPTYHIYHKSPDLKSHQWEDEESSLLFGESNDKETVAIQRDFVARFEHNTNKVDAIFDASLDDGFYNFFRWFLSERLLSQNKMMLHSSAILDDQERVHLFLGPSGAGKTTVTELSHPRCVLGDDMNLLIAGDHEIRCAPGGVGGLYKPQVPIDQTFPVAGMYWLTQSLEHGLASLSKIKQFQYFYSSIANISWQGITGQEIEYAWKSTTNVLSKLTMKNLNFSKDPDFWHIL